MKVRFDRVSERMLKIEFSEGTMERYFQYKDKIHLYIKHTLNGIQAMSIQPDEDRNTLKLVFVGHWSKIDSIDEFVHQIIKNPKKAGL